MKISQTFALIAFGAALVLGDADARHHKKTSTPAATTEAPVATTEAPVVTTATPTATTEEPVVGTVAPADTSDASDSTSTVSTATTSLASTAATTSSSSSSEHATFGTITSGDAECVVGDPADGYISTDDVDWIWTNRMAADVVVSKALIFDQIYANNGSLNYCVRWDSNDSLPLTTASKFQSALERQYKAWNHWLIGYDCWPFDTISINMVGIAVTDASLLDWTDDSLGKIYVGDLDSDGVPMCDQTCYKHLNGGLNDDTDECSGTPWDLALWPKQGLEGGFGSWWGEEINEDNFLENIDDEELQILSHEIGHGFGLPDFYDDTDFPDSDPTDFPKCIMEAGASEIVTEGDGWMLRRAWENVSSRYFD
jgi:hypothetical protein